MRGSESSRLDRTAGLAGAEDEQPDFSWVTPELAVGGRLTSWVAERLVERFGITKVVDLREEEKDDLELFTRYRIELLHLPTPDLEPVALERLWRGVRWVREGLERGEKVLVHCQYGIGRSALLACCVLVSLDYSPLQALELAKRARAKVSPSPEQLHALLRWSECWYRERSAVCPPVTWEELARVAYRHLVPSPPSGIGP